MSYGSTLASLVSLVGEVGDAHRVGRAVSVHDVAIHISQDHVVCPEAMYSVSSC
jgi:hypothetical protein